MKIIRRIEIKYFRSIYTVTLKQCSQLNVLSGRNDVGKSNVLRALNLFFNGNTDWQTPLDFSKDFSLTRLNQVRKESVKGKQYIQISIEFESPNNFKGSLPDRFTVKRSWYRDQSQYNQTDNITILHRDNKCPSSLATAQRGLTQFLNRVHFEYVPAVKDRAFFNHILARLQYSLLGISLEATNLSSLADQLARHIGDQVEDLRMDFSRATNLDTTIEPPKELSSLFQAFHVSVPSGDNQVSLNLRGDGMQARYIPSVLHYIAKKSRSFFIWGFEEPENSLEFAGADALADDLQYMYSKDAQIFITSHSPAMVSRHGNEVSCYRVWQPDSQTQVEQLSYPLDATNSGSKLQEEIGLLRIQQEIHDQYKEKIRCLEALSEKVAELEQEIAERSLPLLLVEGSTDVKILEVAWSRLYPKHPMPFLIRSADPLSNVIGSSGGGADAVARAIESIRPEDDRKVIGLFDHDQEGFKTFTNLSRNFKAHTVMSFAKRHTNGYALAITLAIADPKLPHIEAKNLCIEFLFDENALYEKDENGRGLEFIDQSINSVNIAGKNVPLSPEQTNKLNLSDLIGDISAYRTISDGKKVFAQNIVPKFDANNFFRFHILFENIIALFELNPQRPD